MFMLDRNDQQLTHNKMILPAGNSNSNLTGLPSKNKPNLISSSNRKMSFAPDYKVKSRDRYNAAFNHPPPLATQKAIAMMEYELGNNLVINNNGNYRSKLVSGVEKKR